MGTALSSSQLEDLPAEIRDRSMFSAKVEDERLLVEMQERLQARIELVKRAGRTMDRGVFIEEMRDILKEGGYKRPEGIKSGSLRDLKSTRRLGLIFDMNVAQAEGYARWAADMTPEGLENEPCYELIRLEDRMEIRNWPRVWAAVGGKFYGGTGSNDDYPESPGRMIAKKNDPIWNEISRFNSPWPPYDWGSGMGLRGVDRFESDELGATDPQETLTPLSRPFNEGLRMSVRTLPESARERIRSNFGDTVRFEDDEIILQRNETPETKEQRQLDMEASIDERSRELYQEAIDQLQEADEELQIELAQLSAVAVGRKQLFHVVLSDEQADALLKVVNHFPKGMKFQRRDGQLIAWRSDLIKIDIDEVLDALETGRGGLLLGFGKDSIELSEPHVLVQVFRRADAQRKQPLISFPAPLGDWKSFADSRAADLSKAFGEPMVITHEEVKS